MQLSLAIVSRHCVAGRRSCQQRNKPLRGLQFFKGFCPASSSKEYFPGPESQGVSAGARLIAEVVPLPGGTLMIRWIKRGMSSLTRNTKPARTGKGFARPMVEALEDRIAPATSLAPPTLLDP